MFDFSLIKKDSIIITPLEVKQEIIKEKEAILKRTLKRFGIYIKKVIR